MRFNEHEKIATEGDTVIVYLSFNSFYAVSLKKNETLQTKYGALKHNDMIGKQFGSRVSVKNGFVHFLWPTAELWTLTLPHRTQILYSRDISLIIFNLDLKPGSVVIESGTGSGSLTHSFARAVAPHGRIFTFDFHQARNDAARAEFVDHGIDDLVEGAHRDVCSDGFGIAKRADAVFLDLPHPWLAIRHATSTLIPGGRICSFSPCIEQVQRTSQQMRDFQCIDIVTVECLERHYEVKNLQRGTNDRNYQDNDSSGGKYSQYFAQLQESSVERTKSVDPLTTTVSETAQLPIGGNNQKRRRHPANTGKDDCIPQHLTICSACPTLKIPGHTGYLTFCTYLGG